MGKTEFAERLSTVGTSSDPIPEVNTDELFINGIQQNRRIVGVEWNITQDEWKQIDEDKNEITLSMLDFVDILNVTRVNLSSNGEINAYYGDSDYKEDGSNGRVMARIGKLWRKVETHREGGDTIIRKWIANYPAQGFGIFHAFNQRTDDSPADFVYVGAYEACAYSDDGGTTWYLDSQSGVQPVTGTGDYTGLNANTLSHLDIEEARTYAENIGSKWGLENYHTHSMIQFLFSIVYGNMDSQTELGRGIVDKPSGTGFAGELTGVDSINSNLNSLLTGTGNGTNGYTPITFLGVENPYGNVWKFIDGYEAVDAEYRILDPAGNWSNPGPSAWTSSDYVASETTPLNDGGGDSDGYISDIEKEELLKYGYIGSATAGSSSEYIPDKFWIHDNGENNILLAGGFWYYGSTAGVGCLASTYGSGHSCRLHGARLEFIS